MDAKLIGLIDESYRVVRDGHYVLAAAVVDASRLEAIRDHLRGIPPGTKRYFRWADESDVLRAKMLGVIESLRLSHIVVATTPISRRRQERARAMCLERLMWELDQIGVGRVLIESRSHLDIGDARVIGGLRIRRVIPRSLAFEFGTKVDPELWIPDAVAGAVMTARCEDDASHIELLTRLRMVEVEGLPDQARKAASPGSDRPDGTPRLTYQPSPDGGTPMIRRP